MSVPPRAPAASAPPLAVDDEEDDPPPPPELSDELPHATANSAVATTTVAGKTERFTSTPPRLGPFVGSRRPVHLGRGAWADAPPRVRRLSSGPPLGRRPPVRPARRRSRAARTARGRCPGR